MFAIQQPKSQQCKYKQKHKEDLTCLNLIQIISKYYIMIQNVFQNNLNRFKKFVIMYVQAF